MNNMVIEMPAANAVRLLVVVILLHTSSYMYVQGRQVVIKNRHSSQQITDLKAAGYDAGKLNKITRLKVFFYTWLAMKRAEGG